MTIWQFLDKSAERWHRTGFCDPKFVIAAAIIGGFALAYVHNPDDTMKGALIAAFAGAWGYYLGSSSGNSIIREQVGKALDIAVASQPIATPDAILKSGETARAEGEKP